MIVKIMVTMIMIIIVNDAHMSSQTKVHAYN